MLPILRRCRPARRPGALGLAARHHAGRCRPTPRL